MPDMPETLPADEITPGDMVRVEGQPFLGAVHCWRYREAEGYIALTTRHRDGAWLSTLYRPYERLEVWGWHPLFGSETVRECA